MDKFCSKIVVVDCDRDIQLDRLMRRDSIDRDVAESKINAQLSMGYKKSLASCVINNNGSKQEALEKVDSIVMEWMPSRFRTFGFLVAPFTILVGLSSILAVGKTWAGMWSIKLGSAWLVSSFLLN
ncbi:Dephospho-CoA kinase [Mycoemilia scoparia]|uniref:Dephospho-CoA kinase n=1 Tax=Mycoemilia scoparia TaxID=417184 RepID=A0A9W8A095_9FUNG|nr:Dephospho-CoA kinase [Mycoemilia scoparia]